MLTAVHKLLEPLRAEPGYEVVAMSDHGNSDPTAQRAPLSKRLHVLRDVELLELTTTFLEPILGKFAVGSRGGGVNSDLGHSSHLVRGRWTFDTKRRCARTLAVASLRSSGSAAPQSFDQGPGPCDGDTEVGSAELRQDRRVDGDDSTVQR